MNAGQAGLGGFAVRARYADGGCRAAKASTPPSVRLSFQSGTASRVGRPSSSTSTVPCICPQAQSAATRAGRPLDPGQHLAHRGDAARPPVGRPLLRPAEPRHDLLVLAAREREDRAAAIDQRAADAARAHVDGKIEVAHAAPVPDAKQCAAPVPAVNARFPGLPAACDESRRTRQGDPGVTTYPAAQRPTLHFIGVSTGQSSIMRVFPAWARHLGLDAAIRGIDLPLHAEPARYREAVAFLKADPLSRGALVTTHKLDLFAAARDLFDEVDPLAALMAETSCLSKRGGRLIAHAKDPISSGLAIDGFLAPDHFARTGGEALLARRRRLGRRDHSGT